MTETIESTSESHVFLAWMYLEVAELGLQDSPILVEAIGVALKAADFRLGLIDQGHARRAEVAARLANLRREILYMSFKNSDVVPIVARTG